MVLAVITQQFLLADQEGAIKDVRNEVRLNREGETIPEHIAVGDSKGNGMMRMQ